MVVEVQGALGGYGEFGEVGEAKKEETSQGELLFGLA